MDVGEKIRQLDEQVAAAVKRALDDVRNELRSGLDQAIDDLRGKLAEVSPELPESFFTEEALRQLAEDASTPSEDALGPARAEGRSAGRDELGDDLREALAAVDKARSQNDVLQALVEQSTRFASRAAVLLLRPEGLVGWVAHGFECPPEEIRSASVSAQAQDWSSVVAGEAPRRLAPPRCAQLVSQLDSPVPAEGVAMPVLLRDRVSAVFYADRATADDRLDVAGLQVLVYATALALETLAFRQRESTATLEAAVGEVVVEPPPPEPEPEPESSGAPFELATPTEAEEAEAAEEAAEAEQVEESEVYELTEEPAEEAEEPAPEPTAVSAAEAVEEELELEVPGTVTTDDQGYEVGPTETTPAEDEPEVIELPEEVGEMEIETEEDETESWRNWKPPVDETAEDSLLEVVDLEGETVIDETEPAPEVEIESFEAVPESPTEDEPRSVAGFESTLGNAPAEELDASVTDDEAVELDVDDLELDASALEDLPELDSGPAGETELELDEELPDDGQAPVSWQTEESSQPAEAPSAPDVEAAEPEAVAEPAEPVEAAPTPPAPPAVPELPADEPPAAEPTPSPEAPEPTTTTGGFPGDVPSGGPIEPPTDVQGPGLAFSDKGSPDAESGDDAPHQEARRLARLLVSEIQLYNQDEVEEGRRNGDIYERLKDDIDRSRQLYEERVNPDLRESTDYFYQELVRQLGAGDAKALGI